MMNDQNAELLELVKALTERVDAMQLEIKQLRLQQADVPEETMVAIAAAVAAYLGHRAKRRQAQFSTSAIWQSGTRRRQHAHEPLHPRKG
jgi:methylmalonyl-CoA carboxyltransferase large subunit